MRLSQALMELGLLGSMVDTSLFHFRQQFVCVFVLIYVDDILVTSNSSSVATSLISRLKCEFAVKDMGPLSYFLRIQVKKGARELFLSQSKYVTDLLCRSKMDGAEPTSTPCRSGAKLLCFAGDPLVDPSDYRHIVGAL
jgi:hypothetical protein